LNYIVIFLVVYLVMNFFTQSNNSQPAPSGDIIMTTSKKEYGENDLVTVKIKNNTNNIATIKNDCPEEPLDVKVSLNGSWQAKTKRAEIKCDNSNPIVIKPQEEIGISYNSWNHSLFGEVGRYKISAQ